ncbi:MAG: YdeI/OmpD-associated family protein [Gemmatimonadales bacterium]
MPKDPRIDAYIAKAPEFARPILRHLRAAVHAGCPTIDETIKWGMPNFGHHGIVCGMAAFKAHCMLHFWKGSLVVGSTPAAKQAMGQFGKITSVAELPSRAMLARYVKKAAKLNEDGVKSRPRKHPKRKSIPMQRDLSTALGRNKKAQAFWARSAPSHRWEYLDWITGAKGVETRARRVATTVEWLAAGKQRNWKYQKK